MLSNELVDAIKDLRVLLDRGYPRDTAVKFVSDHYLLEIDKRHLLTRCVFSSDQSQDHRSRMVDGSEVQNKVLGIDGYNVLITVEGILGGNRIILCDDGFIRDLQAIFGKYKMSESTKPALERVLDLVESLGPEKVLFFFDKQVSKSGELAGMLRWKMEDRDLDGDARATSGTDKKVWGIEVSASSDRVIIERSDRVLDIPRRILEDEDRDFMDLRNV